MIASPDIFAEIPRAQYFYNAGIPFRLKLSSGAARIETAGRKETIPTHGTLTGHELNFINQVKKAVQKCAKPAGDYSPPDIAYFMYNKEAVKIGTDTTDVEEVDITAAYFYAAVKLGYIPESFLGKAEKVSKYARLVSLGSLATTYDNYEYDGRELRYTGETQPDTAKYWYTICKFLGDIMLHASTMYDIYFFWVDAIFCKKTDVQEISEYLKIVYGFPSKVKKIDRITCKKERGAHVVSIFDAEGTRVFFPPEENLRHKVRKSIFGKI